MRKESKASMRALRQPMALAPINGVELNEDIAFSVEIPLQMLFDQFTTMISMTDFAEWF